MKKTARILSLALAAAMLASCTAKTPSSTAAPGSQSAKPEGNAARAKVDIRFTQFGNDTDDTKHMNGGDPIKKAIEDAVNISLQYESGVDGYDENINTQIAVGDAPDLFHAWNEPDRFAQWIKDEAIVDIGALVAAEPDRYPTLTKMFSDPTYKAYNEVLAGDENMTYGIYGIAAFADPSFAGVPVYNSKILNEVYGGKVPSTVDEFVEFAKAAGAKGYSGWWPRNNKLTNWAEIDKTIVSPNGTTILPPDGDVWTGFISTGEDTWKLATVSEESKAAVKTLKELFRTKGLDNGVGVKDDFTDAKFDFGAGKIGAVNFGFGYAAQFKDFYNLDWKVANPGATPADLTMGLAPKGSAGYAKTYSTFTWLNSIYCIPTSTKDPGRVLDLVEFLASQKGQDLLFNANAGAFNEAQDSAYWNKINQPYGYGEDPRCKYVWFSYMFSGLEYMTEAETKGWWDTVTAPVNYDTYWTSDEDNALIKMAQDEIDKYVGEAVVQLPAFYNFIALNEDAQKIRKDLKEITDRYLPQMVGGQIDIDAEWPNYVAAYEKAGAAELEKMVNEAIATAKQNYS